MKRNFLKNLAEQLADALPTQLGTLKNDFQKNCHSMLNKAFAKLDIVTREEFDTQTKVLARTRKKIDELAEHIKALETLAKAKEKHRK